MRFLKFDDHGEPSLIERSGDNIPAYGILSHTWGADSEEITYEDLSKGTGIHKSGYDKIKFCAQQSVRDGLRFFWIDTCCTYVFQTKIHATVSRYFSFRNRRIFFSLHVTCDLRDLS